MYTRLRTDPHQQTPVHRGPMGHREALGVRAEVLRITNHPEFDFHADKSMFIGHGTSRRSLAHSACTSTLGDVIGFSFQFALSFFAFGSFLGLGLIVDDLYRLVGSHLLLCLFGPTNCLEFMMRIVTDLLGVMLLIFKYCLGM